MLKSYSLTINQGLRGKIGGVLKRVQWKHCIWGIRGHIAFTNSKAVYLSKQGGKILRARITNVPKVKIVISKFMKAISLVSNRYGYYPHEAKRSGDDEE